MPGGQAYFAGCCSATSLPNGLTPMYRQARSIATGNLVNIWLPVNSIPSVPPNFQFYNPGDGQCYKIVATDAPSSTPGTVLPGWQSVMASALFTALCGGSGSTGATYAQARDCNGNLLGLWKDVSIIMMPYYFKTAPPASPSTSAGGSGGGSTTFGASTSAAGSYSSGTSGSSGTCGIIDSTSPTSGTPGTLLTGETVTSGCGDAACTYGYDTGTISQPNVFVSTTQTTSVAATSTHIAITATTDDIAFIMPTSATGTWSFSTTTNTYTVTIPPSAVFVGQWGGDNSPSSSGLSISDGTHNATFAANTARFGRDYVTPLASAGFHVYSADIASTPPFPTVPVSLLQSLGMMDSSGHLTFLVCLIPFGTGDIHITSVVGS